MEWLTAFLGPARANKTVVKHRHELRLTVDEAAHLASYLGTAAPAPPPRPGPGGDGDAARGLRIVETARCVSCHAIPGLKPKRADLNLSAGSKPDAGCLAVEPSGPLVPHFSLSEEQRQALREFIAGLPSTPAPTSRQTLADDSLRRLNCLGCHARDGRGGEELGGRIATLLAEDPELGGLKGTLTPPNLTAVGDKLRPEYLGNSVRSTAPTARPWLAVRMPTFAFEPGEADAIVAFLQVHDRMQSEPDPPNKVARLDAPATEVATQLIGQRGFGCISCHVLSGRIPPGGEPETLGPDLALAHRRMADRYFHRWIANPQRIIAGTPMPQFAKPIESIPGTLDDQLNQIWRLLASGSLAEVASSGSREVLKREGDRALVVRDMVLLPEAPQTQYIPRGLAIGLKNDHSLLFDADRLTWLSWWHGGFLSRTKSGRLWEWHPDGESIWVAPNRQPPIVFIGPDRADRLPDRSPRAIRQPPRGELRSRERLVGLHPPRAERLGGRRSRTNRAPGRRVGAASHRDWGARRIHASLVRASTEGGVDLERRQDSSHIANPGCAGRVRPQSGRRSRCPLAHHAARRPGAIHGTHSAHR